MMEARNKKSVCMIVQHYYSTDGRVRREAEALVQNGFAVDIIALREPDREKRYVLNGVEVHQIDLKKRRGGVVRYVFEYAAYLVASFVRLTRLDWRKNYAVIQVHNMPNFLVFATALAKRRGAKIVLDVHDPFPELFITKLGARPGGWIYKLLKFEERCSARFAHKVMATTVQSREALAENGVASDNISVIMNLPDRAIFNRERCEAPAKKADDPFVLLFHGTITARNGLGNVVRALPAIRKRVPNALFRVIGEGEFMDDLREFVDAQNLSESVEIRDLVPITQIPQEIVNADTVIWLPERDDFIDLVMSTKTIESLIMGTPVITTKTRCHAHYFDSGEIEFVEPTGFEQIAETVERLFELREAQRIPPFKEEMTRRPATAQKVLQKFDWEKDKAAYCKLISTLATSAGAASTRLIRKTFSIKPITSQQLETNSQ